MSSTTIAVLGTLADFYREPIPYNLGALIELVRRLQPDLLCLDLTPEQWQARDFSDLPPEYREALLPLAHQTDIVVVPIAGECPPPEPAAPSWRGRAIQWARHGLAALHRNAPRPAAANQGWRHEAANGLYTLIGWLAGPELQRDWVNHIDHLIAEVRAVTRRDPGRRILVAVNVRYCHHIRHTLRGQSDVRVVDSSEL